jgi:pyrroline-5-carboxylate reductase
MSDSTSVNMSDSKIGFIGGGMMASALIGGFLKSGAVKSASDISVSEPYAPLREKHAKSGHFATENNLRVAERSDVIWLATKPDVIPVVLSECGAALLKRGCLVVSIAAGVTLGAMEAALPSGVRVIRVMPNLNALVGQLAAGFCCGKHATKADAALVKQLLSTVGRAEEVPEKLMDAVTGLSGSGPAFGFLMVEALADGGVRAGLPRPTAQILAAQTLKGAAEMVLQTGKHPGELKDQVCSPGGTTIAGVEALEKAGFRAAAIGAVTAAAARSAELGRPAGSSKL